ncbi:MAG: protein kinase [Puniceicoccales bacterium]|nr:protein kinase [Puniceicoccales bacterium]
MSNREKTLCFFIALGLLTASVNAQNLILNSSFSFIERVNLQKQRNFKNYFPTQELLEGIPIRKGRKLAQGGYGIIYEGFYKDHKESTLIIKQGREDKGKRGIDKELKNSNALIDAVAQRINGEKLDAQLLGINRVVIVIGKTEDGSLIQERVLGKDLKRTVLTPVAPYYSPDGCPNNLQSAILRAITFFSGLAALHSLDFVHCDIKPGNVVIDTEGNCRIIDLGALKKINDAIEVHSSNGGPEYIEQTCIIKDLKLKQTKLQKKCAQIDSQQYVSDKERQYRKSLQKKLDSIAEDIDLARSQRCTEAQTSYDIYSSAAILLPILFGELGFRTADDLYFRNARNVRNTQNVQNAQNVQNVRNIRNVRNTQSIRNARNAKAAQKFQYLNDARTPNFDGKRYFLEKFSKLNQSMKERSHQSYPEPVLSQLSELQAQISSLDPKKRPSAAEIVAELSRISQYMESIEKAENKEKSTHRYLLNAIEPDECDSK